MPLTYNRVEDLRRDFPGWLIGYCRRWWAWKKLTRPQERAGCPGLVEADDGKALAEKLKEQDHKRSAVAE